MMIESLIALGFITFSLRSIIFLYGAYKERKNITKIEDYKFLSVSVIVPARNEELFIRKCIESIEANNYPKDKFEIVAINDRSTDRTLEILQELSDEYQNIKVVNIVNEAQKSNLIGKPGALQAGINTAGGDIILMTDADCLVGDKWIETIIREFNNDDTALTASFTNVLGKRVFDRFQAIEWAYLHTLASAGVGLGQPLGCYGNNLSIRRVDFEQIGGYSKIPFSVTEDLALLQTIHKTGRRIRYLTDKDADVDTFPCKTLTEYIMQRHRWAVGGLALGWRAAIFIISSACLIMGLIASIVNGDLIFLGLLIAIRIFWDYLIVGSSLNILEKRELKKWIPLSVLLFIFFELIIPFLVLKKSIKWKGQIFKRS